MGMTEQDRPKHEKAQQALARAMKRGRRGDRKEIGRVLKEWHEVGLRTGEFLERETLALHPGDKPVKQRIYALEGGQFLVKTEGEW